jgi:hypothetical protein
MNNIFNVTMTENTNNTYLRQNNKLTNVELCETEKVIKPNWQKMLEYYNYIDIICDNDGLYSGLVLPYENSIFIMNLSYLSLFSGAYCYMNGHYTLLPVPLGVFLNSINYWRDPQPKSIRRYNDIIWAITGFIYQLWRSIGAQYQYIYMIVMFIAICFFPLGHMLNKTSCWLGTFSHCMIHIVGNIGNIILYSGIVPKLNNY